MDTTGGREILTLGRCSVDLYPAQYGLRLEDVETFTKSLGGSAANVAVASARLGRTATTLTGVGNDPFGRFVKKELWRLGVDPSRVVTNEHYNTPITFCEILPPDDFPLYFYRAPTTPDFEIQPDDLPPDIARYDILWLTTSGLSREPSLSAHRSAVAARTRPWTILDLDYRSRFWDTPAQATERMQEFLGVSDVAIGNLEECQVATGETEPEAMAYALLDAGVDLAIVKQGMDGTLAATREELAYVAATPVEVVNGLGAGDAFGGAVCHGLLSGWDLLDVITYASAAGAIVASRPMCAPDMPTGPEVEALIRAQPQPSRTWRARP